MSQIYFKLFCLGDKRLLPEFCRKWGWFQGHNERFFKYRLKLKIQKIWDTAFWWKSTDNNQIDIFLSLENPCTFLLAIEKTWKRIFNTNSELSHRKTNHAIQNNSYWLFNDIWFYLNMFCFDWKNSIFQQTVVRGLLYP